MKSVIINYLLIINYLVRLNNVRSENNYLWHIIAEPDSAHGDEDEIEALEEVPRLPQGIYGGSYEDVSQEDNDRHRNR